MKKRCLKWYENHQKEARSKSSTGNFVQRLNYFGVNCYFCLKSNQVMENNDKLFKAGEIILNKKSSQFWWNFIVMLNFATLTFPIMDAMGLPKDWYRTRMTIYIITLFILLVVYYVFIRPSLFPKSRAGMRYDSIALFNNYLIGRMDGKEERIEFKDIKYIINEGDNEINITFSDEFPRIDYLKLTDNQTQNYTISRSLSKQQKRELVDYLNERIKSENNQ